MRRREMQEDWELRTVFLLEQIIDDGWMIWFKLLCTAMPHLVGFKKFFGTGCSRKNSVMSFGEKISLEYYV
jgi:hypothetical protein